MDKKSILRSLVFSIMIFSLAAINVYATRFMSIGGESLIADTAFNDDVFVTGGKVKIESRIDGDLFAFCQETVLSDSVGGSFNSFCMISQVLAPVGQSCRSSGLSITCNAPVGRNILFFGRSVTIGPNSTIGHNGDLFCQKLVFQGDIKGDLRVDAEDAVISGRIGGNLYFEKGYLTIKSDAVIEGDVIYRSPYKADIANSADIAGEVNWEELENTGNGGNSGLFFGKLFAMVFSARGFLMLTGIISLLALVFSIIPLPAWFSIISYSIIFLISGNIFILLTRDKARATVGLIGNKLLPSLGLGFVIFFVGPVVSIIILCTLVGAPLGIALLFVFGVAVFAGSVYISTFLGGMVWKLLGVGECSEHLCFSTGIILLIAISAIPILGYLAVTVAIMIGLGGLAQTFKYKSSA